VGRFRLTWRLLSHSRERLDHPEWKSLSPKKSLSLKGPLPNWVSSVRDGLAGRFRAPKVLEEGGTVHFFAEKGKLSRFGVYFVHLGVLVILGGALIGFFYGFRGNLNLVEGETASRVTLRNGGQIPLPGFKLKLEQFTVSFYSTGAPKEFKSVVTLREGDQNVRSESIRVNHPLSHKGLSFYQSSYGAAGVEKAVLAVQEKNSGKEHLVEAKMGVKAELPGGHYAFVLTRFIPDLQGQGPAFQIMSLEPNRPHENFFVLQNHPEMEDRRPGAYRFKVREIVPRYYSGLQVNKDPGVPLVWTGCVFMIVGFYLTFFLSHRRLWIRLSNQGKDTLLEFAGSSHRNRIGFEQEFERMFQALREEMLHPGKHSKERGEQA
jgi:cytochrome c biogenesis protein